MLVTDVNSWIAAMEQALDTDHGREVARQHHTSVDAVRQHAPEWASFADFRTGRHITAATATIAERALCGTTAIERMRRVLRDLGLAVMLACGRHLSPLERAAARAHHGGYQKAAASVWCLTVPRPAPVALPLAPRRRPSSLRRATRCARLAAGVTADLSTAESAGQRDAGSRDDLSPPTSVGGDSPVANSSFVDHGTYVGKKSPTRTRAERVNSHKAAVSRAKKKNRREEPHPLHRQRAAAGLVWRCHGIDRGQWVRGPGGQHVRRVGGWHIGAVCDALADAGIDTERFDARAIADRLTEHTVAVGLTWPNFIANPVGFLRALLSRIDWSAPPAAAAARIDRQGLRCAEHPHSGRRADGGCEGCHHAPRPIPAATAAERPADATGVDVPSPRYVRRSTAHTGAHTAISRRRRGLRGSAGHRPGAGEIGMCTACGTAPGVRRDQLLIPTPVCDACWATVDPAMPGAETPEADPVAELAAAAGEQCTVCAAAPGAAREALPSRSVVCDGCWHSLGLDGYQAATCGSAHTSRNLTAI